MKRILLIIYISFYSVLCFGQSKETKYYKSPFLVDEVSQKKGKYSKSIIHNQDSSIETEIRDIKSNKVIYSQTYKGDEPVGVWVNFIGTQNQVLDYSFNVRYSSSHCRDSIPNIKDYMVNNDSLKYIAPKLQGYSNLYQFIEKNIRYPEGVREKNIQGVVEVAFRVTPAGTVEDILVIKGSLLP